MLQWKTYPAGADVTLFDGTFRIDVTRIPDGYWQVMLRHAQYGMVEPVAASKTRDEAMTLAENWLRDHMRKLLAAEGKDR